MEIGAEFILFVFIAAAIAVPVLAAITAARIYHPGMYLVNVEPTYSELLPVRPTDLARYANAVVQF